MGPWVQPSLWAASALLHLMRVLLAGKAALLLQEEGSCCPYITGVFSFQLYRSPICVSIRVSPFSTHTVGFQGLPLHLRGER